MSLPSTDALIIGNFFSACTAAFTKKLMKPILTPCSLLKASWNFLRISITGAMLTSLKVVKMALVDCDCKRRSAMRARRRLMGTRCSGRSPRSAAFTGDATLGKEVVGAPVGIALAATDLIATAAVAAKTSPLVTRPSLPVPGTVPAARLLSAISLAAEGIGTPAIEPPVAATGADAATEAVAVAGAAAAGAVAPALPSVSILAIT